MTDTAAKRWNRGFPREKGYFDCLVEGEEMRLYHFICAMNGKHKWYISSHEEYRGKVLWLDPHEKN